MSDLSEFRRLSKPRHQRCGVDVMRDSMSDEQREMFDDAMKDKSITNVAIVEVLGRWELSAPVTKSSITRHRQGACGCGK
jgi:hypothetical protein